MESESERELLGDGDGTWARRFALPPTYKTRTLSKIKNLLWYLISAAKHRTILIYLASCTGTGLTQAR